MKNADDRPESEEDFVADCHKKLKEARDHQAEWREQAREDFDFVAGRHWSQEDVDHLVEQDRVPITFNRVGPIVDTVGGLEITNRQETRYIPRETTDSGVAEVITGAGKYFRDQCDAEDEESDAFMDAAICGLGWTETRMDYDYSQEGQIVVEKVDPFEIWYDPSAKKTNLSDAKRLWRVKELSEEEFRETFPDAPEDVGKGPSFIFDAATHGGDPRDRYKTTEDGGKADSYWVIEYQWCERDPVATLSEKGKLVEMPLDRAERMRDAVPGLKYAQRKQARYMQAFICGNTLLKYGPAPCKHGFTYKAITAKRDKTKGTFYGIVRAMKDPQRWANKWLSQALHILNTNAKGGAFIEETALKDPRKAERDWAKPDALIIMKQGGVSGIKERTMGQFPAGFDRLMQFAISSMPDVTGISYELMGLTEHQQAGVVENARKQASFTIVARLFNALRRYRKEQGRLMMYFIQEYIPAGTLVRIGDGSTAQYVPLTKSPEVLRYDIVVDDAPFSPNQKEAVWNAMQQLFPVLAKMPISAEVWAQIIPYTPLPESASSKLIAAIMKPQPNPEAEARAQEMQHKNKELEQRGQEAMFKAQQAQIDAINARMEMVLRVREIEAQERADAMNGAHPTETAVNIGKTIAETGKIVAETRKIGVETRLKPQEMAAKAKAAEKPKAMQ